MKRLSVITRRIGLTALASLALFSASEQQAYARVIIGGGVIVGQPYYAYPPYYGYPYYAYPPSYYAPPPPAYTYQAPPPAPTDSYYTGPNNQYCREYHHSVVIDGQTRQAYGHACRQPDGTWHIID